MPKNKTAYNFAFIILNSNSNSIINPIKIKTCLPF
jgi:hypothetical protein